MLKRFLSGAAIVALLAVHTIVVTAEDALDPTDPDVLDSVIKMADDGDPELQFVLAGWKQTGNGVEKDLSRAAYWYQKAARQGHVEAQYATGSIYKHGEGVDADPHLASLWFKRAAEQGHAAAQFETGNLYYHGRGLPLDRNKALQWFRKSAAQGNADAEHAVQYMRSDAYTGDERIYDAWRADRFSETRAFARTEDTNGSDALLVATCDRSYGGCHYRIMPFVDCADDQSGRTMMTVTAAGTTQDIRLYCKNDGSTSWPTGRVTGGDFADFHRLVRKGTTMRVEAQGKDGSTEVFNFDLNGSYRAFKHARKLVGWR